MENLDKSGSVESIEQKIKKLQEENKLLEESISYLKKQIGDFNNDFLTENETDILNKQIDYHKNLKEINEFYKKNSDKITNSSKNTFSNLLSQNKQKKLSLEDLEELKNILILENEKLEDNIFDSSPRDYIESTVNVVGDFYRNYISETQDYSNFLDFFTIEYINFKEKAGKKEFSLKKSKQLIKDDVNTLYISEKELLSILKKVKQKIDFKEDLEIEFRIIENNEIKIKKVNLNEEIPHPGIPSPLQEKETTKVEKKETKRKLRKGEKQGADNRNGVEFIEKNGLPKEIEKIGLDLIKNKLKISGVPEEKLKQRLTCFISYIMEMESDGLNLKNGQGSSAEGRFQYITVNKKNDRIKGKWNAVDTAFRRNYKYFTGKTAPGKQKWEKIEGLPDWLLKAYNNEKYDLRDMKLENQIIMGLVDNIYKEGKGVKINGKYKRGREYLIPFFKGKSMMWHLREFHDEFHYAKGSVLSKAEINRRNRIIKKYEKKFKDL